MTATVEISVESDLKFYFIIVWNGIRQQILEKWRERAMLVGDSIHVFEKKTVLRDQRVLRCVVMRLLPLKWRLSESGLTSFIEVAR